MRSLRAITAAFAATISPVLAQGAPDPLPVRLSVDANGVDLASGDLILNATDVVIGQPGAGGLLFARSYVGEGWRSNSFASVTAAGTTYWVNFGDSSDQFTESGGTFTSDEGAGSTLTYDVPTKIYTYTSAGGTVATLNGFFTDIEPPFPTIPGAALQATVVSITAPNGLVTTFNYNGATVAETEEFVRRLQSITTSAGYMLHFDYAFNETGPTLPQASLAAWWTVTKVTGINLTVEFCAATAKTCTLTNTWPSATYAGPNSQITSVTDSIGRQTKYFYTAGKLTGIRWPGSATDNVTIGYDGSGQVASVNRGFGTWTYGYVDSGGNRTTTVTDPATKTRVVVSSLTSSLVSSDRNETLNITTYLYDAEGRLTRITAPELNRVNFTYDARGNVTEIRREPKAGSPLADIVTSATFPASCTNPKVCNKPTTTTDAATFVTNYVYDATHGGVTSIKSPPPSPGGIRPETRYAYAQKQARYLSGVGTYTNGAPAWVLTETSTCATLQTCDAGADETLTTIAYAAATVTNNLLPLSTTIAAGTGAPSSQTAFTYTIASDLDTIDGPLSGTSDKTKFFYNSERQPLGAIGPDPDSTGGPLLFRAARTTYSAATGLPTLSERGTAATQTLADFNNMSVLEKAEVVYDAHRRPIEHRVFDGASSTKLLLSQTSYDSVGRVDCLAQRMNPAQFAPPLPAACTQDTAGAFGPDRIAQFTYDAASRLLSTKNALGTPLVQTTSSTSGYTANGLPTDIRDAKPNTTDFVYDGFDRLATITYPDGTDEQLTYNSRSLVTNFQLRNASQFVMTYDDLGRMINRNAPGAQPDVAYAYDNFGRATSLSQTGHTLTYSYDQLSRLLTEVQPAGTVSYQYDAAGRRTRITWPGSYYVVYDYDLTNAVTKLRENGATSGAGVLATLGYDNLGRRTSLTRANGAGASTTYGYDGMSRLSSLVHNASGTANDVTFGYTSYSPASEIVTRTVSNALYKWGVAADFSDTYADNNLNQITTLDGASFAHDIRGNTTDDTTKTYSYDADHRMITSGTGVEFYDPAGRLYQLGSGTETRFLYAGAQIIAEYNQSNALQRRFVPAGLDEPIVWLEGTGTSNRKWHLADERGSVIAYANATAGVTDINKYDPFSVPDAANTGRFRYAGAPWIASAGLTHMRARNYSAATGRFMQPDPIGYSGGMNLYGYVGNDPMNFTDPWGLDNECQPDDICVIEIKHLQNPYSELLRLINRVFDEGNRFGPPPSDAGDRDGDGDGNENGEDDGNCSQDPISTFARNVLRGANAIGNSTIEGGTKLAVFGAGTALAGAPFGVPEPGIAIYGVGTFGMGLGSGINVVSGAGLFYLGERRAGAEAFLDAAFGRALKSVPDELSPPTDEAINKTYDTILDTLDSLDGNLGDDFTSCN